MAVIPFDEIPADKLPRALVVMRFAAARLARIKIADGYFTDGGETAEVGPVHRSCADVSFSIQFDNEATQGSSGNPQVSDKHVIDRTFKVIARVKFNDEDTPRGELLELVLADIKRAMFDGKPWDPTQPKTFGWPSYQGAALAPREDGNQFESVTASGKTVYTEAIGAPENAD